MAQRMFNQCSGVRHRKRPEIHQLLVSGQLCVQGLGDSGAVGLAFGINQPGGGITAGEDGGGAQVFIQQQRIGRGGQGGLLGKVFGIDNKTLGVDA